MVAEVTEYRIGGIRIGQAERMLQGVCLLAQPLRQLRRATELLKGDQGLARPWISPPGRSSPPLPGCPGTPSSSSPARGRWERRRSPANGLTACEAGDISTGTCRPIVRSCSSATSAAPDDLWKQLERRSGFPEPFLRDDTQQHRRWSNSRRALLIREDLRDLTQIRQLALVEHLALLLPERVGSPLTGTTTCGTCETGRNGR